MHYNMLRAISMSNPSMSVRVHVLDENGTMEVRGVNVEA